MSYNYKNIVNNPHLRTKTFYPYCYWDNVFSEEELDKLCEYFSNYELERARTGTTDEKSLDSANLEIEISKPETVRKSMVRFYNYNDDNSWIFQRLNLAIEQINNQFYNFDLNGYDAFQYTEYYDYEGGKYEFHMDTFMGENIDNEMRKLSITMLLNEPGIDFEGGEFIINESNESGAYQIDAKRGRVVAFPSFMLHKVAPVVRGTRKSLVVWVIGPRFR